MDIIDDNGRLFGVVNIVDLLVVLLVVAVVIAGAALVFSEEEEPEEPDLQTSYATLDLGTHPTNVVKAISEGDTYSPGGDSKLTITDVYVTPDGNQHRVISRVKLRGPAGSEYVNYDNAPPRLGRKLTIATDLYNIAGRIQSVGAEDSLSRTNATVVVTDVLSTDQIEQIGTGDRIRSAGRTVATIDDVLVYPHDGRHQRVYLTVSVNAFVQQGDHYFGQTPLQTGQQIRLLGDGYTVSGGIQQVGGTLDATETTVVLQDTLETTDLETVSAGTRIEKAGHSIATIEDVLVYPTNNDRRDLGVFEVTIKTYEMYDERYAGETPLREGQTIRLPADGFMISGEIQQVDTGIESESTEVVLSRTLDVQTVEKIAPGDVIRGGEDEVATVESVTAYGTSNPDRKEVFVGLSLETLEFDGRNYYSNTHIQKGNSIPIRTDKYAFSGRIQQVDTLLQRGTTATKTVTLRQTDIYAPIANTLREGMKEQSGNTSIATITDVDVEPTTVLIQGQDGELGVYDHPTKRNVMITAELDVRETSSGVRFKGETIQQGSRVTIDLGTRTLRATVITIE